MPSETFSQVDSHTWSVPPGVRILHAYAEGGEGGTGSYGGEEGDEGGVIEGGADLGSSDTAYIYVGGAADGPDGGFNGGGDGQTETTSRVDAESGGGGGATDIRAGDDDLEARIIVAGGGGGGADSDDDADAFWNRDNTAGARGGASTGESASDASATDAFDNVAFAEGGEGGSQSSGGGGWSSGDFGTGGNGRLNSSSVWAGCGGAGGGGWYGGGGGDADRVSEGRAAAGGGGGSNYISSSQETITNERGGSVGDGYVEIQYADRPENLSSSLSGYTTIELSWDSGGSDIDSYDIYRSKEPDIDISSTSPIDNVSSETTSYSDSGLQEGITYYYLVVSKFDAARTKSIEVSTQTQLPAPVDMSVVDFDDTTVDLSWTLESSDENGIRVFRSLSGDDFTEIDDLSSETTTYTDTSLLNGRDYSYYVEVYTDEVEEETDSISLQTKINDPINLIADSNERGSIDVKWESSLNNGEFDIELEDLDIEETQEITTVDYTTKEISFTEDIDDAIKYEVRIRSSTQDTTGDFQSITTLSFLPRSRILDIDYTSSGNVVVRFDKIDNFDGGFFELYRSQEKGEQGDLIRRISDGSTFELIDSSVEPMQAYYYRIRRIIE